MQSLKRRELITLLGGAVVARPVAGRAQQGERMRRIGVLNSLPADDPEGQARHAAFLQGLQEFGWAVGRNVRIDTRWAGAMPIAFARSQTNLPRFNGIRINTLAIGARLPTMYGYREGVENGGLMSYGANMPNLWRSAPPS
jgi:hypothetical protein